MPTTGIPEEFMNVLEAIYLDKELSSYKVFGNGSSTTVVLQFSSSSSNTSNSRKMNDTPASALPDDVDNTLPYRKKSPSQIRRDKRRAEERRRQRQQHRQQQQPVMRDIPHQQNSQQRNGSECHTEQQQQKQEQHLDYIQNKHKASDSDNFNVDLAQNNNGDHSVYFYRPSDVLPIIVSLSDSSELESGLSEDSVTARAECERDIVPVETVNNRPMPARVFNSLDNSSTCYFDTDMTSCLDDSAYLDVSTYLGTGTVEIESINLLSDCDGDSNDYDGVLEQYWDIC